MITHRFEDIIKHLATDQAEMMQKKSMSWYLDQIKKLTVADLQGGDKSRAAAKEKRTPAQTVQDATLKHYSTFSPDIYGKMIFYRYDPKTKKTLPYYDTFPLVIPLVPMQGSTKTGVMLGLNMHYLPPYERARFMSILYTLINNKNKMDEKTFLKVKYNILKASSRYRAFKPCIKKYLIGHVRTRMSLIKTEDWDKVLMMPLARFMKKSQFQVWSDSIKMINKRTI